MTYLKKLTRTISLDTKQCPAGMGNSGDVEKSHPTAKNLLISPTRKILLNKFTSSAIKSVIPSPSNSNFHLITLYKLHWWL